MIGEYSVHNLHLVLAIINLCVHAALVMSPWRELNISLGVQSTMSTFTGVKEPRPLKEVKQNHVCKGNAPSVLLGQGFSTPVPCTWQSDLLVGVAYLMLLLIPRMPTTAVYGFTSVLAMREPL